MWIFLPGGLLMPARTPNGGSEGTADAAFTNDGEYTLQVRGRVDSHLQNFIRDYMEPMGLPFSEIEYTPQFDYNVRFYTTPEAFSQAIAKATLDIDFLKFKPTAERKDATGQPLYKDGQAYHSVLNAIWGTVCRLGSPGGVWGRYSSYNRQGFQKAKHAAPTLFSDRPVGSSFGTRDFETEPDWWQGGEDEEHYMDYSPSKAEYVSDLLSELSDVPFDQWEDFLTAEDFALVKPIMEEARRSERREARKSRRVQKKSSRRYRRHAAVNKK